MKQIHLIDILVPFGPFLRKATEDKPFDRLPTLLLHVIPPTFFIYWLFTFIPVVSTLLYTLVLIPLSAKRHIEQAQITTREKKAGIYLWYYTVILIGFGGLWSFVGHTVLADSVASGIGWAVGSPFQTELAFYTLGSAVAGLASIWIRGHMITGIIITKSIFWYGAAFVHIQDAIVHQNYALYNIGTVLVGDLVFPSICLWLLYISQKNVVMKGKAS